MSINIGSGNKIKNSNIVENATVRENLANKKSFFNNHPIITSALISLIIGVILLFSFWKDVISFIENLLRG